MCTVSFVPTERGFRLAMNRDEKRTRAKGLPPTFMILGKRRVILPREPDGGTWLAVNDAGICLAVINWHTIEREPRRELVSRGTIIPWLADCDSLREIATRFKKIPLSKMRPFRLLAADAKRHELIEWRWNLQRLQRRKHRWRIAHWFSSGFDEPMAERLRSAVCAARNNGALSSISGLRRLHRSHLPRRGPFSICMHRQDAATVSYAEVAVTPRRATMRYVDGSPCSAATFITRAMKV